MTYHDTSPVINKILYHFIGPEPQQHSVMVQNYSFKGYFAWLVAMCVAIVLVVLVVVFVWYRRRKSGGNPVIVMKDNQYYVKVSEGLGYNITADPDWEYPRNK